MDARLHDIVVEPDRLRTAPAKSLRHLPLVDMERRHRLCPARRAAASQVIAGVLDEERLDVGDVLPDLVVVGAPAEGHERPGDDVDEAPGELPEGRAVARRGELARDPGRDLGDPREVADGVVAGAPLRIAQVEEVELALATGALHFGPDPLDQLGVALGIEDDDDLAPMEVLGDEELAEPGLADARRAEDERMAYAIRERHGDRTFRKLDAVERRIAADRRQRSERIPPGAPAEKRSQGLEQPVVLARRLDPSCPAIPAPGLDIAPGLGMARVGEALGVELGPAEAPSQEEPGRADRDL